MQRESQTIGDMIKQARIEAGLTQRELGERLGITESGVNKMERRKTLPSLSTLERVAIATGKKLVIELR